MGRASNEKMELSRDAAAQRLRTLAQQLEAGIVVLGDEAFAVPQDVHLEIKAGREELEIEIEWETAAEETSNDEELEEPSEQEEPSEEDEEELSDDEEGSEDEESGASGDPLPGGPVRGRLSRVTVSRVPSSPGSRRSGPRPRQPNR